MRFHDNAVNAVAWLKDGRIVTVGANGQVYFLSPQGNVEAEVQASATPIISLALSHDGRLIAAAGIRGSVAIMDRKTRKLERTLIGPGLPVWSVAFFPDDKTLLTGGTDRMIRRWNVQSGEPTDRLIVGAPDDRSRNMPANAAPRCSVIAWPVTRSRPIRARAPGPRFGIFSAGALHAQHQDAGTDHRLGRRPQGAGGFSRKGNEREEIMPAGGRLTWDSQGARETSHGNPAMAE